MAQSKIEFSKMLILNKLVKLVSKLVSMFCAFGLVGRCL